MLNISFGRILNKIHLLILPHDGKQTRICLKKEKTYSINRLLASEHARTQFINQKSSETC